jgi:PAS domain S-box-containing protein
MAITTAHDPALVTLSILIAVLASYTALDLGGRVRTGTGWSGCAWIAAASVAMGGGIWSMHFIAMLAFRMPMPVTYDLTLTLVSLLLAIAVTAIGFTVVGRKAARARDTVLGGIVMGLGIVGMHYTGMAGMRMPASLHYDRPLVALSVLIAIGAATVALWLTLRWQNLFQKTVSAIAMGLAISGMHYTGMAAATFAAMPDGDHPHGHISIQQTELAFAIGGTTVLILCLALIASLIDRRFAQFAERQAVALRQAERSFRLLVQGVTDYAICMLDPLGYVTSWNPGAQRIKGYAAEEIVGRHFSHFYTQGDVDAGQPRLALETALRDGRYETEGWRVRKDGKRFWGNIIIDCIRDDQGTVLGFAKITRDMTERRNAQRILNDAREQLFQAQKMEAIGQLTGGIAHDFNNMLTVIIGNLEMARRGLQTATPAGAVQSVDQALQSSWRAAALIDRLLAFARRQTLQSRPVDPDQLVANMSSMIRASIGESIEVEMVLAGCPWQIRVDPNRLESALLNLVINARDAMPQGGKLTIETANAYLDAAYASRHDGVVAGEYVLLAVTDTGTGMAPEVVARAFEPFYTTKGIGAGSGLGLSQVFGFVKQSGGHVEIDSELGRGTTAKIYLPRLVGEDRPPSARPGLAAPSRAQGPDTILVVEDEAGVRAFSCDALAELGYRVIQAHDAPSGLAALEANLDVKLLLTDVGLPGMNGRDLAAEALRRRPGLRVLYMSGYAADGLFQDRAIKNGAQLLSKPFSIAALASKVGKVIQDREISDESIRREWRESAQ